MDFQLSVAARTLWQEARGEPPDGKQAVAHVIVNRRNSGRWGDTLASVCLARSQFSAWGPVTPTDANMLSNFRRSCALPDTDPALAALAAIVAAAETEPDPTGGALFYYATSIPAPSWASPMAICGRFGNQLFFKPKPPPPALTS